MVLGVFDKEAEDSNYFLCRKIFSAYSTPDLISIQQFQAILRKNKNSLLDPLNHKVKKKKTKLNLFLEIKSRR